MDCPHFFLHFTVMGNFEIVDHTADLALRISGINREDLFQSALDGILALTDANNCVLSHEETQRSISVYGSDDEELLVRFLNEIIELIQDERLFPKKILFLDFSNDILRFGVAVHEIKKFSDSYAEIKAATYHMLKITRFDDNLTVTVIFDV